jgi:hypothetical protein
MQSDSFESGPSLHKGLVALLAILLGVVLVILPVGADEPDSTHVGFSLKGSGPTMADEFSTVMPSLELNNASVAEAMRHLTTVSKQVDPDQTGMTFTVDADAIESAKPVTLSLHNISMYDALRNICKLGHVKARLMGSDLPEQLTPHYRRQAANHRHRQDQPEEHGYREDTPVSRAKKQGP